MAPALYTEVVNIRLDRVLASQGYGSRKRVKRLVKAGRVRIGDRLAVDPAEKIDPRRVAIYVDDVLLTYRRHLHVAVHKPPGILSATADANDPVVLDLLPEALYRRELGLAGRLDKDAEGLVLLTTDGQLAHRLTHPRWKVEKEYLVWTEAPIGDADMAAFAEGVAGFLPAKLVALEDGRARVIVREGKYHQVKRMFAAIGKPVRRLVRVRIGPIRLDGLKVGESRMLDDAEVARLYRSVSLEVG